MDTSGNPTGKTTVVTEELDSSGNPTGESTTETTETDTPNVGDTKRPRQR